MAIVINLKIWLNYFVKIEKRAINPYEKGDQNELMLCYMNDERIEFEKKILKLKSLTPIQKSRLELMMRILFVINVIGNSYFVTKYFYYHKHGPDSINNKFFEDDQKISWYSIFLGLVFCVMGCFFCHRLSVFQ